MRLNLCCCALLLALFSADICEGGNILVVPAEGSHWINMDILLQALHARGHNITITRFPKSWYIKENASYFTTLTIPTKRSLDEEYITGIMRKMQTILKGNLTFNFIGMGQEMTQILTDMHTLLCEFVSTILDNKALVQRLKDSKFDLLLTDPCWGGGIILAKYLNLPLVYNIRWLLGEEAHLAIAPSPLSYIPITGSGFTDRMSFTQKLKNVFFYILTYHQNYILVNQLYQSTCDKYLGPGYDFNQIKLEADIWLMRSDFVFDYPRPTMPNIVYISGFQCKPAKPLPGHLEEFVQSSGEHGVIIMPLGTFLSELPDTVADDIAAAFAKLPQKVIWRLKGTRPKSLGNNTLIVDWMPQNDLLGHPKVKLFVAHGGTNGIQEALYHGVPVVGLPLYFDQYDNLLRLQDRGGAKILQEATMNKDDNFLKAIQEVLSEPSYRENMQRLSELHRDQPVKPMDKALFWIEFVMRHKGAAHLRTESYKLPWYSYYSVDVVAFLSGTVLILFAAIFMFLRCLLLKFCKRKSKKD